MRFLSLFALAVCPVPALAEAPRVVTDIAPIHSLVAQVMEGVGVPQVLLSGAASPHDFQFTFDQAAAVQDANLVIWVGPPLTPWLADALATLAAEEQSFELLRSEDWPMQQRRDWDDDHDHDDDQDHDESSVDPHAWLDPQVAVAWTRNIATTLRLMDPENEVTYMANADATVARLTRLDAQIEAMLAEVPRGAILVPHDAYQYFGARYGVTAIGAISLSDATNPSPAHIDELHKLVRKEDVVCVLGDPQSRESWVDLVREGSDARAAMADPMGTTFTPGLGHYEQTLRAIAAAYIDCLGG